MMHHLFTVQPNSQIILGCIYLYTLISLIVEKGFSFGGSVPPLLFIEAIIVSEKQLAKILGINERRHHRSGISSCL